MKKCFSVLLLLAMLITSIMPTMALAEDEPEMITEIKLNAASAVPLVGQKRSETHPVVTVTAGSHYALSSEIAPDWLEEGGGMSTISEDYTFQKGTEYYLSIWLEAEDGYAFKSGTEATGNYQGRYKLDGTITLDTGNLYTSAITGTPYGTNMTVVVKLKPIEVKDVYIDNTEDKSISYVTGFVKLTGSGGIQAGYSEGETVYSESASVTYSNPKPAAVQGLTDDCYTKVYNLANDVKERAKAGEFEMSTGESTGKVWDNRKYTTIEDGDAVLIGNSEYLDYTNNDGYTRTHIASGDYGKETFYTVEATGWVTGWPITVTAGEGGTASASMAEALRDTEITLTATPQTGYQFKEWQVVSGGITITNQTFVMPAADVEIKAVFEKVEPAQPEQPTQTEEPTQPEQPEQPAAPVTSVTMKGVKYSLSDKTQTATAIGPEKKTAKSIIIQATVTANGKDYKVTAIKASAFKKMTKLTKVTIGKNVKSIGKNAFYGCKKLKTITIKTTKLTSGKVGKNAFKGIYKKATVKCPKSKKSAYKKWLNKKGVPKTAKIK